MATLRDPFFAPNTVSLDEMEQLQTSGTGSLRRGWESGRIGAERNALGIDAAAARANGELEQAAELQAQNDALTQRQAMYAPAVQKVEDVNSIGSGLDWAAGQVGQGVASMVDPVAAATAVGGVGRVAGMLPGGAGKIGRAIGAFGAPAAAFGINQRQMAGEFANTAAQDEELMARTSPQELYNTANMVGAAGGALDTVLPGIIGRQLTGGALRQGMKAMGAGMGPLAKTGLGMLGEGATEIGQGEISRFAQGELNPSRDTSGDWSDRLNEGLGGAVGGGPLIAAGAYADAGYNRAGQAAGFVGDKAGQAADFVGAKTGQVLDMAQEAYDGSALQRGVDTAGEKAKGLFGAGKGKIIDLATDEEGNRSASALVKNLRTKTSEVYDSMEEALNESAILSGTPPEGLDIEGPEFETWFAKNNEERIGLLDKRLTQMAEKGDPKAGELADRIFSSPDTAQQGAAVEEAAQYLQDNSNLNAFLKRAEENSRLGGRIAGAARSMARKVGGAVVDNAVSMGKAAMNGFKEGGKKNMQGAVIVDKDAWQIPPEDKALIDKVWGPEIKYGSPEVKEARERSYVRASIAAELLAIKADQVAERAAAHRVTVDEEAVTGYLRSVGTDLAILVDEVNTSKEVRAGTLANQAVDNVMDPRRPATKGGAFSIIPDARADNQGKYSALAVKVNRIASEIHQAYGTNANEVIEQLALNLGEAAGPTMDYLRHEVALLQSKQGVRHTAQLRRQASQELVNNLDPAIKSKLLKQGVNLGSKSGSETLLKMVESVANERTGAGFSKILAEVIGRDSLDKLVSLVTPPTRMREEAEYINDSEMLTTDSGLQMNDDGEVTDSAVSANGYEASMAERKVEKSQKAGGKIYGFYGAAGLRTSGRGLDNDPFRPVDRATKAEVAAWDEQAKERRARGESPDYDSDPRQKNLPQLIPLRIEGAANTATRRMQNALKLSQSDKAMADELQGDADQGVGPNISTRRAAAVKRWTERAAAGDADAQAKLDDLRNGMFENRRGGFSTKVVSAAEVMKERGTTEPRMVSLFAGYMTQLAKGAENSQDPSNTQYGFRPAEEMRVLSDQARRWLAQEMGADVDSTPGERRDVRKAMAEFFENYGMVVAERLGDLDTEMITPNTILDMDRSAKKIVSLNRRYKDNPDKQRQHGLDANILVFRSRLSTEKAVTGAADGDGEGDVFIKVGDLVRLVRERQGMRHSTDFEADSAKSKDKEHFSGTSKNEKFLADLLEGVAMMVGSGFANGMPAMFAGGDNRIKFGPSNMKRNGNPAVMALGGVPEQIRLVTTNVKGYAYTLGNRPKQPADGDTVGQHSDMFVFARAHKDFPATVDALHKEMGTTQGEDPAVDQMAEYRASLELKASVKRGMDKLKALGAEEYNKRLAAAYEKAGIAPRDEPNTPKDQTRGKEPFVSDARTEQEPSGYQRSLQLVGEERSMFLQLTSEHGPAKGREKFISYLHKKVEQEWRDEFDERGTEMLSDYEKRVYARAPNEFIKRAATDAADARIEEFMENGPTGAMFATFDNMTSSERTVNEDGVQMPGRRANRSSEREHEAKTGKTNKTPTDFTKGQDSQNPVADDYADQRRTSIAQGFKASAPDAGAKAYPQGRMKDKGVFHGEALIDTLISDVDKGMEEVKTWMRMGLSPAFGEGKNALVGGPHLFLPVAIALNPDRQGGYDMVPADHKAVETMRNGIMKTLLTSPMSPASKLMILREMVPASEVDRWVGPSMNRLLVDHVARNPVDDKELQAVIAGSAVSSKTRAEIDAASTKAVADYYRGITGNKRAEELIKALGQRLIDLGQGQATAEQVGEAITWTKTQLSRIGRGLGDHTLSSTVREKLQMAQERAQKLLAKAEGTQGSQAAPEVAAGAPKAQASPQQGGVQLTAKSPYAGKDQRKADRATKFIGRGSARSSTAQYAKDFGGRANTGSYTAADTVFVSAEGGRPSRVDPDFAEIGKAVKAGATIITDSTADREREYNIGERRVAEFLKEQGYTERAPGEWGPPVAPRKLNAQSTEIHNALGRDGFAATHDSPIKHEGKFDWRAHIGKGEGNAAFGAGTYLSTADGVHRSYKRQFTAEIARGKPKPTWLGHFVIDPNGADPGMDQVEGIILEIENIPGVSKEIADAIGGMFDACIPVVESVVGGRTRLEYADPSLMKPFPKGIVDEIGKLHKGAARWMGEFNTALADRQTPKNPGAKSPTYQVSVNISPEQLLDWDKHYSEQSSYVKKWLDEAEAVVPDIFLNELTGGAMYKAVVKALGSQAKASDYLQSLGILGHKYASSGGKNDAHPNYVIYDDSKITTNYVHFNRQSNQSGQDAILETFPERVRMIARMVDADILDAFASGDVEKLVELSDTAILMLRKEYKVGENESNSVNPELKAVTDYVRSRTLNAMEAFVHTEADAAVRKLLDKGPTPLKKVMSAAVKHLPKRFHAVANAVATVAPNVMVSPHQNDGDTRGTYNATQRTASVWAPPGNYGMALTAMHEGVHAATVHAMQQNPELKRLARQVMDAAVAHNKGIAFEYGFENEYEFVAEAMTNVGLQATLRAIPADPSIRGELKALNLWGKFIKLIKKSLGITEESALSQVLEIGAAAMRVQWDKKPPPPSSTIGIKKNPAGRAQEPDSPTPPNTSGVATDAEIKAAKAEVAKTLGPQFRVDFQDITGYSGEFIEAEDLIVIAKTAAAGAMQTTYHESLHAFFSKFLKGNPDALELMDSLANDPKIMARVTAMLAKYPAAQAQLVDGEERLAYIYQFWRAGMLDLPTKPRKFFQKLRRFFAQVLGRISDSERATAILEAFSEGKFANASPSAAGKIITEAALEGTLTTRQLRKMDAAVQKLRSLVMPAHAILTNSDSAEARRLANILWSNPGDEESSTTGTGYLNARYEESARYKNMLGSIIVDLSDRDIKDVAQYLQAKTELADIPYEPHRAAVEKTRALLQRFYRYMKDERGMDIGYRDGSMYFPRVWDQQELVSKADEFKAMLMDKYSHVLKDGASTSQGKLTEEDVAERIYRAVLNRGVTADQLPPARDDGVLSPFFGSKEMRQLAWLDNADIEPFMSKDLVNTLTTYFHGGARAAEYTSRFGEDGKRLESALTKIGAEIDDAAARRFGKGEFSSREASTKWAHRQMQQVHAAVGAIEGTVGNGDFSRAWRNTTAWLTMYQNVRLLPMTLFASVVDPLGMVARGATMTEAFDTLTRALKGVFANWGDMLRGQPKERVADHWEKLALAVGSVDADLFAHHVADEYSSAYMTKGAKRINDFFFRANGMESFNRGMRVGATKSAVQFIQRHAALPEAHSARWLKELGLTKDMLKMDADGQLIVDKHELIAQGMGKAEAEVYISRMYSAINRWVQGAILTPNAAQRPAWSSDPTYSIFFHLKQFSYSFHQTVLKRAVNEMNHGNMAPIAAFAGYIPVMLVSDLVKGLIQGGGELPAHMKGMDLGDHIMRASERAGLLGIGQVGVDAGQDMWSLGGPAVEQIMDSFTAPLSQTTLNALPANPLYKNWVN